MLQAAEQAAKQELEQAAGVKGRAEQALINMSVMTNMSG